MAVKAYENFNESLGNSSSNEDVSPILPKVGTRKKKTHSHIPIEAQVSVTNELQVDSISDKDLGNAKMKHQMVQVKK